MILLNNKRIDGVSLDTVPVGTISPFVGLVAPQGYLLCQGQKVSKNRYKQLYNICKSLFGPETETEFYLPDLRGRVVAGLNENDATMNTIGKILGTHEHNHSTGNHTLTIAEIPAHNHQLESVTGIDDLNFINADGSFHIQNSDTTVGYSAAKNAGYKYGSTYGTTGGGQAHNHGDTGLASNYQPTTVMNYIVKAEMVIPNQSIVYDGLDSDSEVDSLSARQGKILNTKIDSLVIPAVNNTLTSTSTTEALSAAQGKILNEKFDAYSKGVSFTVQTVNYTMGKIDATGEQVNITVNFTPISGYTPIGIVGYNLSGNCYTRCGINTLYLSSNSSFDYSIRQFVGDVATASLTLTVRILLYKNNY